MLLLALPLLFVQWTAAQEPPAPATGAQSQPTQEPPAQDQPAPPAATPPQADPAAKPQNQTTPDPVPPGEAQPAAPKSVISIPKLDQAPPLAAFLTMEPTDGWGERMTRVTGFLQREPKDGQPATERTDVYLGYTDKSLYIVWVCFDSDPKGIRARMVRRENIYDDDYVQVVLDSFYDQRRAYAFVANPLGIQLDRLYAEGVGFDDSFDTLWYTDGRRTDQGYVVRMEIPFRSLRFRNQREQTWGIMFNRAIQRKNEYIYWPQFSTRITGRLNQEGVARGLENISPGRNLQLNPYGAFRSYRELTTLFPSPIGTEPPVTFFSTRTAALTAGLDAKWVLKDALVFDLTVNPDFGQVESDEPQVTANQRFEVFFPEKRPFFLENSSYFETSLPLVFTRRIINPSAGLRMTGKLGPWAVGAFVIDDQAPGKRVPRTDPLFGKRAYFGIVRINRDIGKQNTVGLIYTDREFDRTWGRIGSIDGRFKVGQNWVFRVQGAQSSNQYFTTYRAGPAFHASAYFENRKWVLESRYDDRATGWDSTRVGFFTRPDIRRTSNFVRYRWRPEGKRLIAWGPNFFFENTYDHSGRRLDIFSYNDVRWEYQRQSGFGILANFLQERLREQDAPNVPPGGLDFSRREYGFFFWSSYFQQVNVWGSYRWATAINFVPLATQAPYLADAAVGDLSIFISPITPLRIENTYLITRLRTRDTNDNIFNNHIFRSKWNYQFNRELSFRFIAQYDSLISNPGLSVLAPEKHANFDFLVTYLVHPGTAFYVGYNSDLRAPDPFDPLGSPRKYYNHGRIIFAKVSWLFRY